MNKTITQKARMCLHAAECESKPQSQLSVIGILKKQFRNVSSFAFLFVLLFQLLLLQNAVAQTSSQNITVKGSVIDAGDNSGVPGVSITDNTKKVLGLTDGKGDFSITIAKGATVNFTMIG